MISASLSTTEKKEIDWFQLLSTSVTFEKVGKGRNLANVVLTQNEHHPLVRTTTDYKSPAQQAKPVHYQLIEQIQHVFPSLQLRFNSLMIEMYDQSYWKMKYHTDQSLDLDPNSFICLFSCYLNKNGANRMLDITNKHTKEKTNIKMNNDSIILFSVQTNKEHLHRIVLDRSIADENGGLWLGVTLRLSKTFVTFKDERPYFSKTDIILRIANEEEKKQMIYWKSEENKQISYMYPDDVWYTLSAGDLISSV